MNQQAELFPTENQSIHGLSYIPDFISAKQERELLDRIDQQTWSTELKRRVQHYGWRYDYRARAIDSSMKIGAIPEWLQPYCQKLVDQTFFPELPDQVIINEYLPGQGISPHIDCVPCFEEPIVSISLASSCMMGFSHPQTAEKINYFLEPRSLLCLSKDARYQWKHGINARKKDVVGGQAFPRDRRVSLTFRKVII